MCLTVLPKRLGSGLTFLGSEPKCLPAERKSLGSEPKGLGSGLTFLGSEPKGLGSEPKCLLVKRKDFGFKPKLISMM